MPHMIIQVGVILECAMVLFLEDRIRLDSLEFGLEVADGVTMRAAIGTTTGIGEVIAIILGLVTRSAPEV